MLIERLTPLICPRFLNDAKYREGHIRIVNALPGRNILGLHIPEMKQTAKELSRQTDVLDVIQGLEEEYCQDRFALAYEETVVWGLTLNALKCTWEERKDRLKAYIPVLDNWAVCDTFCCNAKWALKLSPQTLWDFLLPYYHSNKEFEVRFAVVMSMCYLLNEEWLPTVFHQLEAIRLSDIVSEYAFSHPPDYVRMGIAWLLATALAKYPEATRMFMNRTSLPEDVKRLYVRKARESFRTRNASPY